MFKLYEALKSGKNTKTSWNIFDIYQPIQIWLVDVKINSCCPPFRGYKINVLSEYKNKHLGPRTVFFCEFFFQNVLYQWFHCTANPNMFHYCTIKSLYQVILDLCMGSNGVTLEPSTRTCTLTTVGREWTSWLR